MSLSFTLVMLGLMLAGFVFSALFSGLETGLYTINRIRLRIRAAHGDRAAMRVRCELRRPLRALSILLLGTNASNYLGSFGLAQLLHGWGLSDTALIVFQATVFTLLLFVFAETLPKELFRTYTDRWTYALSPLLPAARWAFTVTLLLPVMQLVSFLFGRTAGTGPAGGRHQVSQMIKEGVGAGVLSVSQTTLADRALGARDRRVASLMVPWRQVVAVSAGADREAREAVLRSGNFSRVPVVDRRGHVVGVLSWVDVSIHRERPTAELMCAPLTITPETRLTDAMATLRLRREGMAIVVDPESGRPLGIVTLKNLVEPLTGELAAW